MKISDAYIAYIDMLGVGDASLQEGYKYHEQIGQFRTALCDAVDAELDEHDKVFAFSDCAFICSKKISRLGEVIKLVQQSLWMHGLYLKGGVVKSDFEVFSFPVVSGQSDRLIQKRKGILEGYYFSKNSVMPALMEKNLKGVGIQFHLGLANEEWVTNNCKFSAYYPGDLSKKPTAFLDLLISPEHLSLFDRILEDVLIIAHTSKKLSRYYIPLLVTWINSYGYTNICLERRTWVKPLNILISSTKVACEFIQLVGGEVVYYSLLSRLHEDCEDARIIEKLVGFIASNKRLRDAAAFIPDEICSAELRSKIILNRVRHLLQ